MNPTLFDAREEAIERVDQAANRVWRERAYDSVCYCARNYGSFTADEVTEILEHFYPFAKTHNMAALGPVFRRAAKANVIVKTGSMRTSRIARRHRELVVWQAA